MVGKKVAVAVGLLVGAAAALGVSILAVQFFALVLSGVAVPFWMALWIAVGGWGLAVALGGVDWLMTKWETRNG